MFENISFISIYIFDIWAFCSKCVFIHQICVIEQQKPLWLVCLELL